MQDPVERAEVKVGTPWLRVREETSAGRSLWVESGAWKSGYRDRTEVVPG